jgi:hypothetical protein
VAVRARTVSVRGGTRFGSGSAGRVAGRGIGGVAGGGRSREAVEPLAVTDHAVPLPCDAFDGGGVVQQRIAAGAQACDFRAGRFRAGLLGRALRPDVSELEAVVLATEDGEVSGADE